MQLNTRLKRKGYTLVEILIALFISLFLAGMALFVYIALSKSQYEMLNINRLEEQLRSAMNKMVQDIIRAGYSAAAVYSVQTGVNSNQFMASASDLTIPIPTCILFTYDSDANGILPPLNSANYDKRFGFRLDNDRLQSRPLTDSSFNCTSGAWQDLTDINIIQVTDLTFTPGNTSISVGGTSTLLMRSVTISLTARLISDSTISRTITQTVRIRNDKYIP